MLKYTRFSYWSSKVEVAQWTVPLEELRCLHVTLYSTHVTYITHTVKKVVALCAAWSDMAHMVLAGEIRDFSWWWGKKRVNILKWCRHNRFASSPMPVLDKSLRSLWDKYVLFNSWTMLHMKRQPPILCSICCTGSFQPEHISSSIFYV